MSNNDELNIIKDSINKLEKRISNLEINQTRISIVNSNPGKYPYWNYLLELGITEETKFKIEFCLNILSDRLEGTHIAVIKECEITEDLLEGEDTIVSETKARLFPETLFENDIPTYEETISIISGIIEIENKDITHNLLLQIYKQSMFKNLLKKLLHIEG